MVREGDKVVIEDGGFPRSRRRKTPEEYPDAMHGIMVGVGGCLFFIALGIVIAWALN